MSTAPHPPPPARSRLERFVPLGALLAVLGALPWFVHGWFIPSRDAAMYLETARALLRGEGYSYLGAPFLVRPPGFSLLIAPLLAALGPSFLALNAFVSILGVLAAVALYAFARPRVGWALALCLTAVLWLNPSYQRLGNQVMSDLPGLACILACLVLERRSARAPSTRSEVLVGLAIGLSSYLRSAALLLLPALACARIYDRLRGGEGRVRWASFLGRRIGLVSVSAVVCLLPWSWRNAGVAPDAPVDQLLLYDYATGLLHEDPGDPGSARLAVDEVLARSSTRLFQVAESIGSRMQGQEAHDPWHIALSAACVAALSVTFLRRREPAEAFALGLLVLLTFYFGFNRRLVLPSFALALVAVTETVVRIGTRLWNERGSRRVAAALLLGLVALDFQPHKEWESIERQHAAGLAMAAELERRLPPDARLASFEGFRYVAYLDRPVYSLCFAIRRADDEQALEAILDAYDLNTVVLSKSVKGESRLLPYFRRRYGIREKLGELAVLRVRP